MMVPFMVWAMKQSRRLSLALFVLFIFTDYSDHTAAPDYLAVFTNSFDRSSHFHIMPHLTTLFIAIYDSTPAQVIGRKFNRDLVSR